MKRLVLIDSHAVIHRAWHALPPLTSPDGQPVNAVYGFASILLKMLKELKPDFVVAAFDHEGPTFRHLAFERYKATRAKAPDALYAQIPIAKGFIRALGIPALELNGYEADDIIGTVAAAVERDHPDTEIIIVTGDLDTLQLVGERVKVFTMKKGLSDTVLYDEAAVRGRYGLAPAQLIDFKGLRGDPSDNIPGVKGIGEKGAIELLRAHGSIEEIYRALKKGKLESRPVAREALKAHEADALFSKTLATIDRNVPIKFVLASARLRKSVWKEAARIEFERLGFQSLVRRLAGEPASALPPSAAAAEAAPAIMAERLINVKGLRRRGHILMLNPSPGAEFFIAADAGRVFALPRAAAAKPETKKWLETGSAYAFDVKALLNIGFPEAAAEKFRDLMIMWWLLEPGRRTYQPQDLVQKESGAAQPQNPAELAARLFKLAPVLEERLRRQELLSVYENLEAPITPILWRMERSGIALDSKPLAALSKKMAGELKVLEGRIYKISGGEFNINSPKQLAELLFEKLKLAPQGIRKTEKSGALSTRESELAKLRRLHPVIGDILRYRELAKLKSTYADTLPKLVGKDGRIHTAWNQTGTATGRLSSSDPNLQNIPIRSDYGRDIRKAFIAARGLTLVAFDYSQLELRIAASLAGDGKMIAAFRRGEDIHRLTASEVNNLPIEKVTPELRYRAKALNFGVLYGMGARAFAESAGISREEAGHFIEEYFLDFSGISRFIEETKESARKSGYTKTAFGRKRFFPDIAASNFRLQRLAERQAVNFPIQGSAADIMKKAMIEIDRHIQDRGWGDKVRLLLQIHDELIFEVRNNLVVIAAEKIKDIMEKAWPGAAVPMEVEVKRGKNWGEL